MFSKTKTALNATFDSVKLSLVPRSSSQDDKEISGLSVKGRCLDQLTGREYYVKCPKLREPRKYFDKAEDPTFHQYIINRAELLGFSAADIAKNLDPFDSFTEQFVTLEKMKKKIAGLLEADQATYPVRQFCVVELNRLRR